MACSQLPSMSERILESRDIVGASVDPHRLVALARAVVGHTGSAPRRSPDLPPPNAECLRGNPPFVPSPPNPTRRPHPPAYPPPPHKHTSSSSLRPPPPA